MNTQSNVLGNSSGEATTPGRIRQTALAAWRQRNFVAVVDQFNDQFTFTDHGLGLEFKDKGRWKAASAPRHRRNCSQRFRPCAGVASYSGHYCSKMILPPLDLFIATFNSSCRRAPDSVLRSTKKNWRSTGATVANRANHITFSAHRDCTLAQSIF
jgi:hypothetical protein